MIPQDLTDYRRLVERVDSHAQRVHDAWPQEFACRAGCSGCCHRTLGVFAVEAANIRAWLNEREVARAVASPGPEPFVSPLVILDDDAAEPCAMLDRLGQCRIYEVRPLLCRTHGLPTAVPDGFGGVRGDVCPQNFAGADGMKVLPSADFLSIAAIDTVLAAVDLRFTTVAGLHPGERVPLATLAGEAQAEGAA